MKKTVREMPERLYPAFIFTDHSGIVRKFRKFTSKTGECGIKDITCKNIIIEAVYPRINVCKAYDVFIAGGDEVGWEILSYDGVLLNPNKFGSFTAAIKELGAH